MMHASWRASPRFVSLVVCVAVFTDVFLYGLIVPVLPFILSQRLKLPDDTIQHWASILLACYGASILIGSLIFGWLGDHMKSKQLPFIFGLVVMGCATLLFSLTSALPLILLARILQGLSTAIVFTIGFSMLNDTVGNEHIGGAVGLTSMSLSLGLFGGPIIGGILYDLAGYFAVFVPAFVLIGVEIILRILLRPSSKEIWTTNENPEEVTSALLSQEQSDPKERSSRPALLILLRSPRFLVALAGMCTLNMSMTAYEAVLPVYLREIFDYSPSQISIALLSSTLPMVAAPIAGTAVDRFGTFPPAVLGFALIAPSTMLLAVVSHNSIACSIIMRVLLVIFGCGVCTSMPAMMAEISMATAALEKQQPGIFGPQGAYSQAYGLSNAAFSLGTLAGPLYAGYIREWAGWTWMSVAIGALSATMVLLILIFLRDSDRIPKQTRC